MTKYNNTESALVKFEEAATMHAEATEQGDYKTANKCYAIIAKAATYLKEKSEIQKLSGFLEHNSTGVRLWAATYLLPFMESEGVSALEKIAKGKGIHSLDAEMTLREWRNGNLKL
jgi:hypothetical protein